MFVRQAISADLEIILGMARANCEETCAGETYNEERSRDLFNDFLHGTGPSFFVVEDKRKLIGFLMARMCLFDYRDGFYTAQSVLYVLPENRGSRAAVLLTKHLVAWSTRIGAAAIIGGNDNGFNSERTAKFLEHFGFERIGILMKKRLVT